MGYFTWTLANKTPRKSAFGYTNSSILKYGSYGAIVCPDNTIIKENAYEGYGKFDGKDIYELVVDWNKNNLPNIVQIPEIANDKFFDDTLKALAIAFANDDTTAIDEILDESYPPDNFMRTEWKRSIGIAITCKYNHLIPYPIKIVNTKSRHKKYDDLPPSISTQ